jgi:hypothetical protein
MVLLILGFTYRDHVVATNTETVECPGGDREERAD